MSAETLEHRAKAMQLIASLRRIDEEVGGVVSALRKLKENGRRHRGSKPAGAGVIRYRDPDNPTQVWSGRGRPPRWFVALRNSGRLEEALVKS